MWLLWLVFLFYVPAYAEDAKLDPYEKNRAAMAASIEKQRGSVMAQAQKANAAPPSVQVGFFTAPWALSSPIAAVAASSAPAFECEPIADAPLAQLIGSAAQREGVKPELVRAVIDKESARHPCAVSAKGAQGLMQIMPSTAEQLQVSDPFDPKQNVDAGTKFLKQLLDRYKGNMALALGAYNAGPGRVDQDGGVPDIPETQAYVQAILEKVK